MLEQEGVDIIQTEGGKCSNPLKSGVLGLIEKVYLLGNLDIEIEYSIRRLKSNLIHEITTYRENFTCPSYLSRNFSKQPYAKQYLVSICSVLSSRAFQSREILIWKWSNKLDNKNTNDCNNNEVMVAS